MSTRSLFQPASFFCGLLYGRQHDAEEAVARLQMLAPAVDLGGGPFPFVSSAYYRDEMGEPLFRRFVSFAPKRPPEWLPQLKMAAMRLETDMAENGRRRVNLDPGYLTAASVIIATAKNHCHRVPLADGVYAQLELVFEKGRFHFLPWTYPDFKSQGYLDFFMRLRERHMKRD